MHPLSRIDIIEAVGPIDDLAIARLIETGATAEEFAEAQAWLTNDEAMMNVGKALPTGRVAELVEILADLEEEDEEEEGGEGAGA